MFDLIWLFKSNSLHHRKKFPKEYDGVVDKNRIFIEDPRKHGGTVLAVDRSTLARDGFHNRELGDRPDAPKTVPRIKPLVRGVEYTQLYDLERIIGIAIGCARPREKVDIKICRQSL